MIKKTFHGGYHFNCEGKPQEKVIESDLPLKAIIPLKQGFGREVKSLVAEGDKVKAGQIIGRDDHGISSPVHASVNGTVESLVKLESSAGLINAVVINADANPDWQPLAGHNRNWQSLTQEEIETLLYSSGVTSLDSKGIPTRFKTSSIVNSGVNDLIIRGTEDSPYNPSLSALLAGERCNHFVEGIQILQKIMPQANVHLAINSNRRELNRELLQKTEALKWLTFYSLSPRYPQGNDRVLTGTILGSRNENFADAERVVVLSAGTVLQVHDAVVEGKPLIETIIALCGPGWKENFHIRVRIGTPIDTITGSYLDQTNADWMIIPNNPMTSGAIADLSLPVDRIINSLTAVSGNIKNRSSWSLLSAVSSLKGRSCCPNVYGEVKSCIFCGYCEEVCPVGLIPHLLDKHARRNLISKDLINYGILNCVECNLCSYVCPSKIPVARHIKLGQQKLIDYGYIEPEAGLEEDTVENYYSGQEG
ncbi:MAG: 4Fe-4S dicluster domain-containing protein [Dethiobacteria bacterium]